MSELMNVLVEAMEAMIAGDGEKYLSLISERSKEAIDKLGGIDTMIELSNAGLEIMGVEAVRELTLATIDQYKLVDGKLENVSLEALSETESFNDLLELTKDGLEDIRELILEEEEEEEDMKDREFQMTRQQFDRFMADLEGHYLPELPKVRISGDVCVVKVPGDFPYMNLVEGLQTK